MWVVKVIEGLSSHDFGLHNGVLVPNGVYLTDEFLMIEIDSAISRNRASFLNTVDQIKYDFIFVTSCSIPTPRRTMQVGTFLGQYRDFRRGTKANICTTEGAENESSGYIYLCRKSSRSKNKITLI
jgi:hypothetical protein